MSEFEQMWQRIVAAQGEVFHQKTGNRFTYRVSGAAVVPDRTPRQIPRSHFERASHRRPLDGPGRLQDLQGPSYIYAILTDPRIGAVHGNADADRMILDAPSQPRRRFGAPPSAAAAGQGELPLGTVLAPAALTAQGFQPLALHIEDEIDLAGHAACNWTTIGEVPDAAGLYAFTLERDNEEQLHIVYVGMTEHLWMVTKGVLPSGHPRGGQRYGRPRHAGATRQHVNRLITRAVREGWTPRHWVKPYPAGDGASLRAQLLAEEAALILRWNLGEDGWNRR